LQPNINNQKKGKTMAFRVVTERDVKRVAVIIYQSLCSHFQSKAWRSCVPCPNNKLIKYQNGWAINLNWNAILRLFPSEGKIEVMKGGQLKTRNGISAFSTSHDLGTSWVSFYNPQKRLILEINQFGSIS